MTFKKIKNSFLIVLFMLSLNSNAQIMGGLMIPNSTPGTVSTLNCASPTRTGTLVNGLEVTTTVTASISYTGGNGGFQEALGVQSTGVTGLTASSSSSTLNVGSGSILFTITGTPVGSGTATFPITVGGKTCSFTMTVAAGLVASLNCTPTNVGTAALIFGVPVSTEITSTFSYTGGNGGAHSGQIVNSTTVTGLTATLAPGNFAIGAGNLVYTITGTPNGSGNANFAINIGGKICTLTLTVFASSVAAIDCAGATVSGMLKRTVNTSGITITIPYTGGNGGLVSQTVNSTSVTGVTATLTAINLEVGSGTLTYTLSGIPSSNGTANFAIAFGTKNCNLSVPVAGTGAVVNCGSATRAFNIPTTTSLATLNNGTAFSGTYTIPYTGGDGVTTYGATSQTVNGITFTRVPGTQAVNAGSYVYNVTGNLINKSSNAFFTLEGCPQVGWSATITVNPGSVSSNGCNGGATGASDLRTFGWQNTGAGTFTLGAGYYVLSFNANITANGQVYNGNPNKPLEGKVAYRLVNTSTGVAYATTDGNRTTFSSCTTRGVGSHSAGGGYSQSAGATIPAGTYRIEVYGESYMGGCSSGGGDSWAGCGLSVNSCTITITPQ